MDNKPPIPHFTGISKINVDVPEDADVNFFVGLFITEELIDMIAGQTNLCAERYRETNPNLPNNSRASRWYNVTKEKLKILLFCFCLLASLKSLKSIITEVPTHY